MLYKLFTKFFSKAHSKFKIQYLGFNYIFFFPLGIFSHWNVVKPLVLGVPWGQLIPYKSISVAVQPQRPFLQISCYNPKSVPLFLFTWTPPPPLISMLGMQWQLLRFIIRPQKGKVAEWSTIFVHPFKIEIARIN